MTISTPYYLIDQKRMLPAMQIIRYIRQNSGAKSVLALKCFSSWCVFDFMNQYMDGTTSSSLYEARLGFEKFGGENHGYSVAYDDDEIKEVTQYCNKIIFNSLSQLSRFKNSTKDISLGLRLNPGVGHSSYSLSDTVSRYSRLGVRADQLSLDVVNDIDGVMFHVNCENYDVFNFIEQIELIEEKFYYLLGELKWVSFGGGLAFTSEGFPVDDLCLRLKQFSDKHAVQIYLEPGEAAVKNSTSLIVKVLDIVENELPTLIVDAGVETHALDALVYQFSPSLEGAEVIDETDVNRVLSQGRLVYRVCGRTCLAGDFFGLYSFNKKIKVGDILNFTDMAGYTMVKKNFFNGIKMPSICYKDLDGNVHQAQESSYEDFRDFLS